MPTNVAEAGTATRGLYRMPWSMSDNGFSWLDVTRACNLQCEYCYQRADPEGHLSLEEIRDRLERLLALRKCDVVLIAGGEPLTHPQILEITRMVAGSGARPVLLSNGFALSPELIARLNRAGIEGFVFHVDAGQRRPGWIDASEAQLNGLRQRLADMVHDAGGLVCGFNTVVLPRTLEELPRIVEWTVANPHKVSSNVLIPVRGAHRDDPWDYFAGAERIAVEDTPYATPQAYERLTAAQICAQIRRVLPGYGFHSYLGGTVVADAPKWLFGTHLASRHRVFGNLGATGAEAVQQLWHATTGRYVGMPSPTLQRRGRLLLALGLIDRAMRRALGARMLALLTDPRAAFERLYVQSLVVMQPHDVLANGEQDECDGCPNKTVFEGRLVSECRLEDYLLHGRPITAVPKAGRCERLREVG